MATFLFSTYETEGVIGRMSGFRLDDKYAVTYGYETATGRFSSVGWDVSGDIGLAAYSYFPNSSLLSQVAIGNGSETLNLVTTYFYEPKRDLRTQVRNEYASTLISQYDYQYDELGRRTSVANSGQAFYAVTNAFNLFGYDNRSQLTESTRYEGADISNTSNPVQPEYRAYNYDSIGNRQQITEASESGTYTTNALDQYTEQAIPGDGIRDFAYDSDGNLTDVTDDKGAKEFLFNTENRLIAVEPKIPVEGDKKVESLYDFMGRRVKKTVYLYSAGAWTADEVRLFVYDGWNMIEESISKDEQQTSKYYLWGHDLSGSLQGAGGIGGLLASVDSSSSNTYYYIYDVNGNIGQLINATNGDIAAHYEHDPFGKVIKAEGSVAEENPFRFSTKYFDEETELYYYGYRYYSSNFGRWLNRDPFGENGGRNIYIFAKNNPIDSVDPIGLFLFGCTTQSCKTCSCCCVDKIKVDPENPEAYFKPFKSRWYTGDIIGKYGHKFDVIIDLSYINPTNGNTTRGDCTLSWKETVTSNSTTGSWILGLGQTRELANSSSGTVRPWKKRSKKKVGKTDTVTLPDTPQLGVTENRNALRELKIVVTVTSEDTNNCKCPNPSKSVTIVQKLKLIGGQPDTDFENFEVTY
ncbi:MAG: RHS repeat domain-containing protein [bacterium]